MDFANLNTELEVINNSCKQGLNTVKFNITKVE